MASSNLTSHLLARLLCNVPPYSCRPSLHPKISIKVHKAMGRRQEDFEYTDEEVAEALAHVAQVSDEVDAKLRAETAPWVERSEDFHGRARLKRYERKVLLKLCTCLTAGSLDECPSGDDIRIFIRAYSSRQARISEANGEKLLMKKAEAMKACKMLWYYYDAKFGGCEFTDHEREGVRNTLRSLVQEGVMVNPPSSVEWWRRAFQCPEEK